MGSLQKRLLEGHVNFNYFSKCSTRYIYTGFDSFNLSEPRLRYASHFRPLHRHLWYVYDNERLGPMNGT